MTNEIEIIENGEVVKIISDKIDAFRESNTVAYPFGEIAKTQGQSPLTMRVDFIDDNSCKFRGDRKTPYPSIMIVNLSELLKHYMKLKKVTKAIIYDNRQRVFNKIVLLIDEGKIIDNRLPLYITNYKLKP